MADGTADSGLRGGVRRAVGGALDATVGRVSHTVTEAAMEVTGATAQQVIEDLEPYLIEEAIPRIVEGLTPYLTDTVVPEVLEGITDHLVADTVPDIVDGVTAHLVAVTVPQVVDGVTPRLVADLLPKLLEDLRPYLEAELVPRIVEGLVPYIQQQVAPELIDGLMPKIRDEVAPQLIDALMPRIEAQIAPQLVDALMPKITDEVAPQLVDALLPKIRAEVVPLILDDIVDDPRVRDLIREQSAGLLLDALESVRENVADADVLVERFGRRLLRRQPRPQAQSALTLMFDAAGDEDAAPARLTREGLSEQRAAWRAMPVPPAPPGREFAHAGAVTRLAAFALDSALVAWLVSQGLSALISLLDSVLDPTPNWLVALLTTIAASSFPVYLGVCWWLAGRTIGSWLTGTRVCTPDGRNPGLVRSLIRAWVGVLGFFVWLITGVFSLFDARRRSWLDRLLHTEVRYVVPLDQQRRYIRQALLERREQARSQE
jgi:uncharacterized RDD family membrane protein YckC